MLERQSKNQTFVYLYYYPILARVEELYTESADKQSDHKQQYHT